MSGVVDNSTGAGAAAGAVAVCPIDVLTPDLGAAALVEGEQVAVFLLSDGRLFAVQNLDPFSGAHVMSRGITGSLGEEPTIASPIYKQVFSLVTGECLNAQDSSPRPGFGPHLVTYPVTVDNGQVHLHLASRS